MSVLEVDVHAARGVEMRTSHWPDPFVPDVSLPEMLLATAFCQAERTAILDPASGRVVRYRELADQVRRVAAGLAADGFIPGQTFAIIAPNSPEWLVGCFGAMLAGGIVTGINPLAAADEIATQLADSDARFILTIPAFAPTARAAAERAGGTARIVVVGPASQGAISFDELFAHGCQRPLEHIDPASLALLPYSSGTTGLPKGVRLTHLACMANVVQMRTSWPVARADRVLAVTPFFHAVGLIVLACRALIAGATLVTLPRFEIAEFLAALQDHRITQSVVVPSIVLALAQHPDVDRYDLSALRWLACMAAPLTAHLQQACSQRIGCPVGQGYGMAEATVGITLWPVGLPPVPGSAGRLLPGVRARLVDPETGADVGTGGTGELLVRSPALMTGYLGNAAATAATIDREGWLHTGDIARFDADGNLFLIDRIKDLIKVPRRLLASPVPHSAHQRMTQGEAT